MRNAVSVDELRQNLSGYLRRVARGERLTITDRDRPVAELGPLATPRDKRDRLIAEGRVSPPRRRGIPEPLRIEGDPCALSRALAEVRGGR
jgi:prevent-host-death family protein